MGHLFRRFLFFIGLLFGIIRKPELEYKLVSEHPAPKNILPGIVYIVGGRGFQKWAFFRCPKHEDEIIRLSLMPDNRPRWSVSLDFFRRPTIHPSVRQLEPPYAHFWVKKGCVEWCSDTGHPPTQLRRS